MDELCFEPDQDKAGHADSGKNVVEDDREKPDSGVGEDSNSCGLETGDLSDDDDDDVVLSRVVKRSASHRILDDDSDDMDDDRDSVTSHKSMTTALLDDDSDDMDDDRDSVTSHKSMTTAQKSVSTDEKVSTGQDKMTSTKKQGYTDPEEVLALVMADSDDDEKQTDKQEGRQSMDDSSDEETVPLATAIKLNAQKSGLDDLFDTEETTVDKATECTSSESESEKSEEEDDEGFDESKIDPKLLAKMKKGAAKKPTKGGGSRRGNELSEKASIHSETQRIIRESRVSLPYHQPAPKSINDFLARVSKKQHEYKVLKGVRESTKARVLQDILMKTTIQSTAEKEKDKYSDSDEDWNPEEEKEKTLKERLDAKAEARLKSGSNCENHEEKSLSGTRQCDSEGSNEKLVQQSEGDADDDFDELPDICEGELKNVKSVVENIELSDSENAEKVRPVATTCASVSERVSAGQIQEGGSCREEISSQGINEELLYDWEKCDKTTNVSVRCDGEPNGAQSSNSHNHISTKDMKSSENIKSGAEIDGENTENIDPNSVNSAQNQVDEQEGGQHPSQTKLLSSGKKDTKSRLSMLAGIDLDSVKPCLSGQLDSVINLVEAEERPQHPGILQLMDRLCKHSVNTQRKRHSKDVELSVISKTPAGLEKEELKLDTFTYHVDSEETNPLLKLETPGAKLVALKEQLHDKIRARRELARQQRQEMYDLDNEEGGFEGKEEEEAEMSDHSDTDVEDDEFEEQFGDDEEDEFDEEIEEKERERNPFADDEAEDDGGVDDADDIEDEDNMQLKLDVSDEELETELDKQDEEEDANHASGDDDDTKDVPSTAEFKEPKISDKPFSMFGSRSRESSISDTPIQSAQRPSAIQMPIEDSQDLFVATAITPEISDTQQGSSSQDFSFFLDDSSQSNMLDADGYLKTKSSEKKKRRPFAMPSVGDDIPSTQGNFDELLGLCSGQFVDNQTQEKKSSRKGLFGDALPSNTQDSMEALVGMCSGVFTDRVETDQKGSKRKLSDDEGSNDSFELLSDNDSRHLDKEQTSEDDEVDGDTDREADTDEDIDDEDDKPTQFTGFLQGNKHGKIRQEFVDEEAELSGSDVGSDEDLDLPEEDDIMEIEEADKDAAKLNQDELRDEVGRVHLKQLIDEDKRELMRFQEMYLPDGDLHSDGAGRMRRFRWSNMDDDTQQDMFGGSDEEPEQEEQDDYEWRKQRFEREKFLHDQHEKEGTENENSQFLKLGKVFLRRQESLDVSTGRGGMANSDQSTATNPSSVDKQVPGKSSRAETPGFPGSFYKLSKQKRGSFLARSKEALAKIADMTKPVINPSAGAKSSGKFTFQVISPEKTKPSEPVPKIKQRKAHVPSQKSVSVAQEGPVLKKPKLDTNSIFHHL